MTTDIKTRQTHDEQDPEKRARYGHGIIVAILLIFLFVVFFLA